MKCEIHVIVKSAVCFLDSACACNHYSLDSVAYWLQDYCLQSIIKLGLLTSMKLT